MMQKIHVFVYILFAVSGPPVVVNGTMSNPKVKR